MSKEKSMAMGGGVNSLSQSRSVTAHPDILKTLGWVKERTSNSVIVESGKTSTGWWRKWSVPRVSVHKELVFGLAIVR